MVNLYCRNNFNIPVMDQTMADAALQRAEKLLVGALYLFNAWILFLRL